ncbi:MAG TPA: YdcF family protein [Patescibacteria group bacterium]
MPTLPIGVTSAAVLVGINNMKKYDAILVLGITGAAELFKKRVDLAIKLYNNNIAPKIIFTGRSWGGLKKLPKISEARRMRNYALKKGVPKKDLLLEEKAKSTLGNIYFTKKLVLESQSFRKILLITHSDHLEKTKFCCKLVLGPDYSIRYLTDGTNFGYISNKASYKRGHLPTNELVKVFGHIKPGDDRAVGKIMAQHKYYKSYDFSKFL